MKLKLFACLVVASTMFSLHGFTVINGVGKEISLVNFGHPNPGGGRRYEGEVLLDLGEEFVSPEEYKDVDVVTVMYENTAGHTQVAALKIGKDDDKIFLFRGEYEKIKACVFSGSYVLRKGS